MKEDEKRFLILVYKGMYLKIPHGTFGLSRITPRNIINDTEFFMHYKRAWYLLEKWCDKDWYEFGVTLDLGWLTDKGKEKAKELLEA